MGGRITRLTIQPLERCGECGNFKGFDQGLVRRVDEMYIVPKKSRTYSSGADLTPYCIEDHRADWNRRFPKNPLPETESPEGLYPTIIVPKGYVGHLLRLIPISEEQEREDSERKRKADEALKAELREAVEKRRRA